MVEDMHNLQGWTRAMLSDSWTQEGPWDTNCNPCLEPNTVLGPTGDTLEVVKEMQHDRELGTLSLDLDLILTPLVLPH